MRHNITLTETNTALLKELCAKLGLKPSAVIVQALRLLRKTEVEK